MELLAGVPPDGGSVRRLLAQPAHELFRFTETDQVRKAVGQVFKPHDLRPAQGGATVEAGMYHLSRGQLSLSLLEYGGDVEIDPGRLEQFYLIQIPLQGEATIQCGGHRFVSHAGLASFVSPNMPLRMRWGAGSPQVILRIEAQDMLNHCRQLLGCDPAAMPEFAPALDFTSAGGAGVRQVIGLLIQALADDQHPLHHPMALRSFKSTLFNSLLFGVPSTFSSSLSGGSAAPASPYYVRRAEEFIRANLAQPLSLETIAEQAGISVRTLHAGFQTYRNTTPLNYLRDLRLARAREDLLQGKDAVTEVALRWGFSHLGRFAQDYKRRFGESPSTTRERVSPISSPSRRRSAVSEGSSPNASL